MVNAIERYGDGYDYYFFGGPTMLGDAPALRLFGASQRIVTGVTPTDVPSALSRNSIFIIPSQIERVEKQLSHVGTVITNRYPDAERLVTGEKENPQLILYIVSRIPQPIASGGQGAAESK